MAPITEPQSRLVYSTEHPARRTRGREPKHQSPQTHFVVRRPATVAHLSLLGICVEEMPVDEGGRTIWLAPLSARREVEKFELTLDLIFDGLMKRRRGQDQQEQAPHATTHRNPNDR